MDLSGKVALVTGRVSPSTSRGTRRPPTSPSAPSPAACALFRADVADPGSARDLADSDPEGDAVRRESLLGRAARPQEVVRAVLFLASEGTDFMTVCILDVNGASYPRS